MKNEKSMWSHRAFFPLGYKFVLAGSGKVAALLVEHMTFLERPKACISGASGVCVILEFK